MSVRLGWARVVGDVNMSVRRGAWYEVTRLSHEAATLDVHHEPRSIPRSTVEIVTSRPHRWSLVERPYDAVDLPMSWGARYGVCPHCSHRAPVARGFTQMPCPRDRKSTRLNSSHDQISYAVFCLKKKKKHVLISYGLARFAWYM